MFERHELLISPMLVLEIGYLFETGRITEQANPIIDYLKARIGLAVCPAPFADIARRALAETWTRDPFDRIITAQARFADAPLATKVRVIMDNYANAVWE